MRANNTNANGPGYLETFGIGGINTPLHNNEGSGTNQAVAGLIFHGRMRQAVSNMAAYVLQDGSTAGSFQMTILQPVSSSIAVITAVTPVVTSITSGIFVLPLTSTVILEKNKLYYLAVYNQVSDSELGAVSTGLSAANDSPPIHFRVQNIAGFTVGSSVSVSDISLQITPWLAAF